MSDEPLRPPTPVLDPTIERLTSRFAKPSTSTDPDKQHDSDEDLLDEIDGLDDEFMGGLRERRMQQLQEEVARIKDMRESDHGRYTEMTDEKEVIKTSAREDRCVIHFYHRDFKRCKVMDKHLELIAPKYFRTRFLRVFVENVPWLVDKLEIKILPCVGVFVGGVTKDRIVGFENLGGGEDFKTSALEERLALSGVIELAKPAAPTRSMYSSGIRGKEDDDGELDLD